MGKRKTRGEPTFIDSRTLSRLAPLLEGIDHEESRSVCVLSILPKNDDRLALVKLKGLKGPNKSKASSMFDALDA